MGKDRTGRRFVFDLNEAGAHYRDVIRLLQKIWSGTVCHPAPFFQPKMAHEQRRMGSRDNPCGLCTLCALSLSKQLGSELHYICTINEANMGIQVAAIAERYKRQMMAQMQAAQTAPRSGDSADGTRSGWHQPPENDGRSESCRR